jgi:hypothetical protein
MATTRGAPYLFIHLLIFLSVNMRNQIQTSCSNSPVLIRYSASVHSIYLLYIALSSAPQTLPTCTLKSIRLTLICILFIHICFSSTSIINTASLPDSIPRSDVTEQSYNRSRSAFRRLGGLILRLTHAKSTTSCRCTRKKFTNANQSQSWTQGQISILDSQTNCSHCSHCSQAYPILKSSIQAQNTRKYCGSYFFLTQCAILYKHTPSYISNIISAHCALQISLYYCVPVIYILKGVHAKALFSTIAAHTLICIINT